MEVILIQEISNIVKDLIKLLSVKGFKISCAESMTGGLLASSITKEEDASTIFDFSCVVYSNEIKTKVLNCQKTTIDQHGVYSLAVVEEMILGLEKINQAEVLIAISGVSGPNESDGHQPGEVFIAIKIIDKTFFFKEKFTGTREVVQLKTVQFCLTKVREFFT